MEPRGLLQFSRGRINSLTLTPNEKKEPTASLKLSAELTPELAEKMACREAIFREDGKPHLRVTRHDIEAILRDVDLSLPSPTGDAYDRYRPEDIASFRVNVDGMQAELSMLVRIKGHYAELVDFLASTNADTFDFAIRALQEEFDWSGKGGQGVRAAVEAGTTEASGELFTRNTGNYLPPFCVHCSAEAPKNEDGRHMVHGELVACDAAVSTKDLHSDSERRGPAIPDAREMGQRRAKRQRTRAEMSQPSDAELQASVEVVQ